MIPVLVINLDRRPDRLAFMARQLDGMGVAWERVAALDGQSAPDAALAPEVRLSGHRVGMGRGSQACAVTNFAIHRRVAAEEWEAALVLQDDVRLAPELPAFLRGAGWIAPGIGVVQMERYGRPDARRLVGPPLGAPVGGRTLRRLHSKATGAGAYVVTARAARTIIAEKPVLDMPIDHFLFSPNLSPLWDRLGVGIVVPALAAQGSLPSDIAPERARRPRGRRERLGRGWTEVNRAPVQALAMARGARWVPAGGPGGSSGA